MEDPRWRQLLNAAKPYARTYVALRDLKASGARVVVEGGSVRLVDGTVSDSVAMCAASASILELLGELGRRWGVDLDGAA